MKPEEFESYVRKGLGRAITLLKEEASVSGAENQ